MEWWEKEAYYAKLYASGKQAKDLWKYIPDKLNEAIAYTSIDMDGYWIFLEDGWIAYDGGEDCRTIHCYNIADLKKDISTIRKEGE